VPEGAAAGLEPVGTVTSAARRGTIGFVYEAGLRAFELKRLLRADRLPTPHRRSGFLGSAGARLPLRGQRRSCTDFPFYPSAWSFRAPRTGTNPARA